MELAAGTRLGPYEIVAPLGAGGMGEVYRARDTRLGRNVAVKILPAHAAASPESRARFDREARAIAALNHPNICTLHDVGRSGDRSYLVMELVEGETLAARLRRGPMSLAEVLRLGSEIASALDRAHRVGVIHRDLKPGNVMLTKSGTKLMDFGLARSVTVSLAAPGGTEAPTETAPITGEGRIVGTFKYMAPEQLQGREADARSDIWALGVTLYEMATGRPAFEGGNMASLTGAILRDEPRPIASHVPLAPPLFERLVRTCLAKDPDDRWQSAGDLARELEWLADQPAAGPASSAEHSWSRGGAFRGARIRWPWIVATAAVLALAIGATWAVVGRTSLDAPSRPTVVADAIFPNTRASEVTRDVLAVSPDGTMLVAALPDSQGTQRLFLRGLDQTEAKPVEGSEGANVPFWSPDSRSLAFWTAEGRLVRLGVQGGVPQTVCHTSRITGGAWNRSGWILFGRDDGPILRVRDTGGTPQPATRLDASRHEQKHDYPDFLGDGRHFTFLVDEGVDSTSFEVRVGSVDGGPEHTLMRVQHAPRYDGRGWLVFMRDRVLFAQRIDPHGERLIDAPVPMRETPERMGAAADPVVSLSPDVLAFPPADTRPTNVLWWNRRGLPAGVVCDVGPRSVAPVISPSGKFVVARRVQGSETSLLLINVRTGEHWGLTSLGKWNSYPNWMPHEDRILYATSGAGRFEIRTMLPDDPNHQFTVLSDSTWVVPDHITPDGTQLLYERWSARTVEDVHVADLRSGERRPYLATEANEAHAALLPDGRTAAFVSDVTGRFEIYLDGFPDRHRAVQLTHDGCGGTWSRFSFWLLPNELVYIAADNRTVHSIALARSGGGWTAGADRPLFVLPYGWCGFCPDPDGSRFLIMVPEGLPQPPMVTLVQNWKAALPH